jgi:hypothetical protein
VARVGAAGDGERIQAGILIGPHSLQSLHLIPRAQEIEADGVSSAAVSRSAAYTGRMHDALAVMMILGLQCAYKILYNRR